MTAATVFVRLDDDLARRLDHQARRLDLSRPELVRDILDDQLPPASPGGDPNQLRAFDEVLP